MLRINAGPRLILPLVYVFLDATLVSGQDQGTRLDVLKGTNNESSCQLRDTIHSTCNLVTPPPALDVTPIPSLCTCNKVYFNIWSACSYSTGNNTLPVFQNWGATCTSSNVDLDSSAATAATDGGLGIDIPTWAVLPVPGNTSFDVQRAAVLVNISTTSRNWNIFQKLAPVISALVATLMTFILILYCRPRIGRTNWRGRIQDLFRPVHKVRSVQHPIGGSEWSIDQDLNQPSRTHPPMVDPLSPVETTNNHFSTFTVQGNPSAPPSGYGQFQFEEETTGPAQPNIPGGRVYPFAPTYQLNNPQETSGGNSNRSSLFNRIPRFRPPWKSGPTPIRVIQPSSRFKVDHREQSLNGISSAGGTESSFTSWGPERPRGSFDVHEHEDNPEELEAGFNESRTDDQGSEHERVSLISVAQRISLQNSAAHSSSINSIVGIIPPSNSSSSPRDSRTGSFPNFSFMRSPPPVPPPPTQPAPPPPPGQRTFRRDGPLSYSLAPDRLMTTIQEHDRRTPSPIQTVPVSAVSHTPRPSVDNPRPLPLPANSSPSRPDFLSVHQRSNSQNGSASSVYEENSAAGFSGSGASNLPPSRSGSMDSQNSFQRSRPLPTPVNNTQLPNGGLSQTHYPPIHQRTASGSSSSGANLYQDPFAPSTGHGRGLDWDDGASFYLESVDPPRLMRSPSPLEAPGDPAMLFHPSVRGAGYRGTPN